MRHRRRQWVHGMRRRRRRRWWCRRIPFLHIDIHAFLPIDVHPLVVPLPRRRSDGCGVPHEPLHLWVRHIVFVLLLLLWARRRHVPLLPLLRAPIRLRTRVDRPQRKRTDMAAHDAIRLLSSKVLLWLQLSLLRRCEGAGVGRGNSSSGPDVALAISVVAMVPALLPRARAPEPAVGDDDAGGVKLLVDGAQLLDGRLREVRRWITSAR